MLILIFWAENRRPQLVLRAHWREVGRLGVAAIRGKNNLMNARRLGKLVQQYPSTATREDMHGTVCMCADADTTPVSSSRLLALTKQARDVTEENGMCLGNGTVAIG